MVKIIKDVNVRLESVAADEGKVVAKTSVSKKCVWKQQLHGHVILGNELMRTVCHKLTTPLIAFVEANSFWNWHQESFLSVGQPSVCHYNWRSSLVKQISKNVVFLRCDTKTQPVYCLKIMDKASKSNPCSMCILAAHTYDVNKCI